jgi:glycosyltransferase involved in cell wall biosynthesis
MTDLHSPRISIIVPARNEAKNLEIVLPQLPEVHEIIVVDGHSVDGTAEVARRVRPDVDVITQTRRGKGNALVCGFERATGDIIVMFDADTVSFERTHDIGGIFRNLERNSYVALSA